VQLHVGLLVLCVLYISVCCCTSAGGVNWNLRPSNRIQIRNLPAAVNKDQIDLLVSAYGTVKKSQLGMHSSFHSQIMLLP